MSVAGMLSRPLAWLGVRRDGAEPKDWSAPTIQVTDPDAPARERFNTEIRAAGSLAGIVTGAALTAPGGYNNQPVLIVVTDRDSGVVVVDHRFHASSPTLGNVAAEADLHAIRNALDAMTVDQFCEAYSIPR
jgi:hypothetical protein